MPKYIQNTVAFNGYDNAVSVKTITSEDIEYLQNYARNEMHKHVPQNVDLTEYYGSFSQSKVFLRGHVKLLE